MTQLASDTFDRANTGTLGASWTAVSGASGQFEILSNAANCPSGTGTAGDYYNGVTWPADQYSEATIGTVGTVSDEGSGPAVRWAAAAFTGYIVQTNTTQTRLYKVSGGSFTGPFNDLGGDGAACAANDVLRATVTGTSPAVISVTKNGSEIIRYSDGSSPITSGNAGLWGSGTGGASSVASWTGGDTSGGSPSPGAGSATYTGNSSPMNYTMTPRTA